MISSPYSVNDLPIKQIFLKNELLYTIMIYKSVHVRLVASSDNKLHYLTVPFMVG